MSVLHPNLPPLPDRIKRLPVDARGFPVPWFVEWFHKDGTLYDRPDLPHAEGDYPDFRIVDARKLLIAYTQKRCWICGGPLGRWFAFTVGPMCAINRISSELPSHRDCARFAARACPFLTKPAVERRETNLPEGVRDAAGVHLHRNAGVTLVWVTNSYRAEPVDREDGNEGVLFHMGEPHELEWYCEGRQATRDEIMTSIHTGLPFLREGCDAVAERHLNEAYQEALKLVPAA